MPNSDHSLHNYAHQHLVFRLFRWLIPAPGRLVTVLAYESSQRSRYSAGLNPRSVIKRRLSIFLFSPYFETNRQGGLTLWTSTRWPLVHAAPLRDSRISLVRAAKYERPRPPSERLRRRSSYCSHGWQQCQRLGRRLNVTYVFVFHCAYASHLSIKSSRR